MAKQTYYLWTVNAGARMTVTNWTSGTYRQCYRAGMNRWGGGFYVSTISDPDKARRRFTGLEHDQNS